MKLYKFWTRVPGRLRFAQGEAPASFWGGSNLSLEDAHAKALQKLTMLQQRIDVGGRQKDETYEAEIREEIIQEINPRNIVSRTRYGALVLNSEELLMIDIDEPPLDVFGAIKAMLKGEKLSRLERILRMVRKKASQPCNSGLSFRVYETRKGVRLLVTGRSFDPRSDETLKMFRDFNCDRLYAHLCRKQNCFRARLTPKPSRIKCRTPKVVYPRTSEEQATLSVWLEGYDRISERFSVCRYIETIGSSVGHPIVSFHDSATRSLKTLPLA